MKMDEKTTKKSSIWNKRLKRHIPILKWLPLYKKTDLVADMIAGLTLGLTLIPQSIAYAGLAGLSPEYGLYSSFMGSFIYVIFGTIKEVSIGPTSLLSLLTFEFTKDLPIEFAFLFTFICGCIVFFLGILQFGFLVNYISSPVTTSFQSATALIIISSQLKNFLGLPKFKTGRFFFNILSVGERITETKIGDLTLGICCCVFLLSLRKLKDIKIGKNEKLTKKDRFLKNMFWFISISRNALCVFISCFIAYIFSVQGRFPFNLSGNIPAGLPPLRFPPFSAKIGNDTVSFTDMIYTISPGIFILPLIAVLANVTIAKAFCVGSPVDATQEMLTLGICNITGSFVGSMPTCGAFTRSAVSNSSGVRTPLAGLFTGTLVILVIRFLTPYFYYIPKATLASILICAVLFMIDWQTFITLKKAHKKDFLCSIVTFSASLTLGIQIGLLLGVAMNISYLLYLWARPSVSVEVKNIYFRSFDRKYYLVTPDAGLYFPASDFLRNKLTKHCIQNIPVVIDCVNLKGTDYTIAQAIGELGRVCKSKGQKLLFINMRLKIYRMLKNSKVDLKLKQYPVAEEELNNLLFESDESEFMTAVVVS